ncbi:MAG: peptidoglycan editing factor PgeF [Acidobacteriota bacterium]|nr:peptidoglycan editing factor PgeF [Acidobacteriota bacterium]
METIISDKELEQAGFYWRVADGIRALICAPLELDGFANGFSTRVGGTSPMPENALNLAGFNEDTAENILENRRRFLKLFAGEWALAGCWQVHGSDVRLIKTRVDAKPAEDARGDTIYCDAIVSNAPGVLAGVKTADCVPILIGDPKTGSFAAVHAGWRGTLAEVATKALGRMVDEYKTQPQDVSVAIGPAAGSCCYEVGADVIGAFRDSFPGQDQLFTEIRVRERSGNGQKSAMQLSNTGTVLSEQGPPAHAGGSDIREDHACIDLLQANRRQLVSAGVDPDRINIAPLCTMCRTDLFFSYRREKNVFGKVGRLMSVIGRTGR